MEIKVPVMGSLVALIVIMLIAFANAPHFKTTVLINHSRTVTRMLIKAEVAVYVPQKKKLVLDNMLIHVLIVLAFVEQRALDVKM